MSLKIILVDDNDSYRKALKTLLEREYDTEIIGEASNGDEFLKLKNHHLADIILMDVMMPEIDGIALAKMALWENNRLRIIAITMHVDRVYLESLVGAGFKGCIFKDNIFTELQSALDTVMEGQLYFPDKIKLEGGKE